MAEKKTHNNPLSDDALDQLFRLARTYNGWEDKPIPPATLQSLYELMRWAPTSANTQPARWVFITSDEGRARLKPHLDDGNVEKTMAAPCTVICAHTLEFYEELPEQFPHADAKSWFVGNDDLIRETAFRNGTLQGAYLIMAARALGLDTGAMSGFDKDGVAKEFLRDDEKANFLINIGYGTEENLFPRSPRLSFDKAVRVV